MADIARIAAKLVSSGRGMLAADESVTAMNARLLAAGAPDTAESRPAYREMRGGYRAEDASAYALA